MLAALGGTALLPLGASAITTAPELLPWGPQITPELFLTVSSRKRSVEALEVLTRTQLLPVLAPAGLAQAAGPVAGAIQLWLMLEPARLLPHGLDVQATLALIKEALGGELGPVAGRHRLKAWTFDHPAHKTLAVQDLLLPVPGHGDVPLSALGTSQYTLMPTAWRDHACFSFFIQPRSRLDSTFLQRCLHLLQAAGGALPDDLEIQIGKIGDPLQTLPCLFVEVTDDPWGPR